MASVNKAIIVGNLGRDPETRYLPDGGAVTNISIATTDSWKDKSTGEKKEQTEWHKVAFFGKLAEIAGEYLKKGSQVYIEGRIRTRKWQDKDGQDRYTTEIIADSMQMGGGGGPRGMPRVALKRRWMRGVNPAQNPERSPGLRRRVRNPPASSTIWKTTSRSSSVAQLGAFRELKLRTATQSSLPRRNPRHGQTHQVGA